MANPAYAAGFAALCVGNIALEVFSFLDPQQRCAHASSSAQATLLGSALDLMLPLGAAGVLFTAAAFIYHHLSHAHAAAGEAGNRRLSELVVFALCVSAGILDFCCFVQPAGGVDRRALGLAAHRALPTAATATFFSGMMLIIIAHVGAGGKGGAVAGADHGANLGPVRILTNIALGAAAGLVFLMTLALSIKC